MGKGSGKKECFEWANYNQSVNKCGSPKIRIGGIK